jgi:IS5 family transposase
MIRYKSSRQLSISEFTMPFEVKLDENNRWVVLSKIVPWEEFAQLYYKNFKSNLGAPTKDALLVLGVIIIKHIMKTDDLIRKVLKLKYLFVIRHLLEQ